jgi:hypothetical protein
MVFVNPVPAVHQNEGVAVAMQDIHLHRVNAVYLKNSVVHMVVVFGWVNMVVHPLHVRLYLLLFVAVTYARHFILKW